MEKETEKGKERGVQTGQHHYSQREHVLAVMVQTGMPPSPPRQAHIFESGLQLLAVWGGWGRCVTREEVLKPCTVPRVFPLPLD